MISWCLATKNASFKAVEDKSENLRRAVERFKHFEDTIGLVFHPAFHLPEVMGAQQTHFPFKQLARCSFSLKQLGNCSNLSDDVWEPLAGEYQHWFAGVMNLRCKKLPGRKKNLKIFCSSVKMCYFSCPLLFKWIIIIISSILTCLSAALFYNDPTCYWL